MLCLVGSLISCHVWCIKRAFYYTSCYSWIGQLAEPFLVTIYWPFFHTRVENSVKVKFQGLVKAKRPQYIVMSSWIMSVSYLRMNYTVKGHCY